MSKIYKKLIGMSLSISALLSFCISASALDANAEMNNQQIVPVSAQSEAEKEESKETLASLATDVGTDLIKKGLDTVTENVDDKKTEQKEKADEVKNKLNEFVDGINENLDDITQKQEDAQEQVKEDMEKMNEIKDKEKQIEDMKNSMEIQKAIDQSVNEFNKNQDTALDDLKNSINDVVTQNAEQAVNNEKK